MAALSHHHSNLSEKLHVCGWRGIAAHHHDAVMAIQYVYN
jgi:hypothetical protein